MPVGPVVGGAVEVGVVQPRALSHVWGLVSLVGGVRLTLAVSDVGSRARPGDGGGRSVVRLPEADHQDHGKRAALLRVPGAVSHPDPDVVDGEGVVGLFASESAGDATC